MLENKKIGRLSLGKSPRRNQSTTALQSSDGAKVQQKNAHIQEIHKKIV